MLSHIVTALFGRIICPVEPKSNVLMFAVLVLNVFVVSVWLFKLNVPRRNEIVLVVPIDKLLLNVIEFSVFAKIVTGKSNILPFVLAITFADGCNVVTKVPAAKVPPVGGIVKLP